MAVGRYVCRYDPGSSEGDAAQLGRLKNALDSLPDLTVVVESGARDARQPGDPQRVVTMLGLDRYLAVLSAKCLLPWCYRI